jgi:glycosyltransferase involved in cell wall biosynthesis
MWGGRLRDPQGGNDVALTWIRTHDWDADAWRDRAACRDTSPELFFPIGTTGARRLEITLGLVTAFRLAPDVEVRVHEVNYDFGRGRSVLARATRAMWRSAHRISVHTDVERQRFGEAFGVPLDRISVAEHGESFVRRTTATKQEARTRLGLPHDEFVFLSIGFVQPHKGFDRAVRAFARLGRGDHGRSRRLEVVGSVRLDDPHHLGYVEELRDLVAATPGVNMHEGYVGDEMFDLWIVAADALVLPYRFIWSSGVIERAHLYDRPVIASRVGGLADQAEPGTMLVDDDDELLAGAEAVDVRTDALPRSREPRHLPEVLDQLLDRLEAVDIASARHRRKRIGCVNSNPCCFIQVSG